MVNDYDFLMVGAIAGTHGLRGEVKVISKTDFPELRFKPGSTLFLRRVGEKPFKELVVSGSRLHKQFWLVSFKDHPSINDVENWKGTQLCVSERELVQLPEGTYYIHQLIGLRVVADDGREVGELVDVLHPGANDVYVVKGNLQKRDVLLPAIPSVVQNVDITTGVMTVHLISGLLDADE